MAEKKWQSKFMFNTIIAVIVVWIICLLGIFSQYRETSKISGNVVELGNSIMSFHNSLHFKPPYVVTHANDMALNIQLIYSLRVQLDADYQKSWLQPDVTHLLYVIDTFIEKSRLFLSKNLDVLHMVDQLKMAREHYADSPQLKQYYVEVGAYMFEALFTEGQQSPEIYRALDHIMQESQSLPNEDRQRLQLTLANISTLLSQYAEGGNLVDRLLQHEIYRELYTIEQKYYATFGRINALALGVSSLLLITLLIVMALRERQIVRFLRQLELDPVNTPPIAMELPQKKTIREQKPVALEIPIESKIDIQQMVSSLNGDLVSVKMLLKVFIEDHQNDARNLVEFIVSDKEAALRTSHSLKGVAGTIGATELKDIATEIEAMFKNGDSPTQTQLTQLSQALEGAVNSAQYWLERKSF